jgi:hypothetical protein
MNDEEILKRFVLKAELPCSRPKVKAPTVAKTELFQERYYVNFDGGTQCQILDAWVGRLSNRIEDNRRAFESVIYHFENGKWIPEYGSFYKPKYTMIDRKTGMRYFVVRFREDQFSINEIFYFNKRWSKGTEDEIGEYGIIPVRECRKTVYRECRAEYLLIRRAAELLAPN